MRVLTTVLFIAVVATAYYRYRDHFYALESATDSTNGRAFWTILALAFAIVIAICYFIIY
jgi:uncharacterized membrane protein YidH (DUF202 family)